MKVSVSGVNFIKSFEGLELRSYRCQAGVWTIGFGSTTYENGTKVKAGEQITKERAEELLAFKLERFAEGVNALGLTLSQPQFDALVSFAFNVGLGALRRSTLLKIIRQNPGAPEIRTEFMKWVRAGGMVSRGLTRRRTAEANMYFG
jgi:lysozyme